jgi:hypothetical protein
MLTSQLKEVLYFKNHQIGSISSERIVFRKFQINSKSIDYINKAGLQENIDDFIEVENNYSV